ncbi:MAG: glycosyltransferase family 2 protein [Desulfobaccales bacterium]|jgi:glycosyltransferase involved in cell wall biosynthesis
MRDLSIILPCLNEAETLGNCILKAQKSIEALKLDGEIIVADNGSTDGSLEIAKNLGALVVHVKEKGYGNALRGGIEAATGKWIIMADADDSYDFGQITPFVKKLQDGYDLVMGCRLPKGGGKIMKGAMPWKHRWIGNPLLSGIGRLFFESRATDFHCGMRAFTREAYQRITPRTTGMEFASEMVIKATLQGLRIAEVPITLYKDGRSRPPHLRSWRDGWRHLRFMLLYSPTWLFLLPGVLLLLIGTAFGARLQMGSWKVGPFGFDTNTMLVCSMCQVVGLQIFFFGIFTRVFAISEGLLPKTASPLDRIYKWFTLERGVLLGLVIFLVGLAKLSMAVLSWKAAYFGAMSYPESLRQVIPAVTLITVGVQVIFSSFFLSILSLPRK